MAVVFSLSRKIDTTNCHVLSLALTCTFKNDPFGQGHNQGTISKFVRAKFLIYVLVFVSPDFELDTHVSCEESTVGPVRD